MTRLWHALKLVNVRTDEAGRPTSFQLMGKQDHVARICNYWKLDDNLWRKPTQRDYYKLQTASGLLCVIYHERSDDTWYLERMFD